MRNTESQILDEITQAFGRVPNIFKAYAKYPPLLEANWRKLKALMMEGVLRRAAKEAIALLISHDNDCKYCVSAHSAVLRSLKFDQIAIDAMLHNDLTPFSDQEIALIEFTRRANADWHSISHADTKALLAKGISETEWLEAIGIMEIFIAFNRFVDLLDVENDFE